MDADGERRSTRTGRSESSSAVTSWEDSAGRMEDSVRMRGRVWSEAEADEEGEGEVAPALAEDGEGGMEVTAAAEPRRDGEGRLHPRGGWEENVPRNVLLW